MEFWEENINRSDLAKILSIMAVTQGGQGPYEAIETGTRAEFKIHFSFPREF